LTRRSTTQHYARRSAEQLGRAVEFYEKALDALS
jgi:hypothetical protein